MTFDSNMTFKKFFNILKEARGRKAGRVKGVDVDKGDVIEFGDPTRTLGKKGASADIAQDVKSQLGGELKYDPNIAKEVTKRTFGSKLGLQKEISEGLEIDNELYDNLIKTYSLSKESLPNWLPQNNFLPEARFGTALNSIFTDPTLIKFYRSDSETNEDVETLSKLATKVKLKSLPIQQYVDSIVDKYIELHPESIVDNKITTFINNHEHYKYGAHSKFSENDPKFKIVYDLNSKSLYRQTDQTGKKINVNFPEYSTYKMEETSTGKQRSQYLGHTISKKRLTR